MADTFRKLFSLAPDDAADSAAAAAADVVAEFMTSFFFVPFEWTSFELLFGRQVLCDDDDGEKRSRQSRDERHAELCFVVVDSLRFEPRFSGKEPLFWHCLI